MRTRVVLGLILAAVASRADAAGLLVPSDAGIPPLSMVRHVVSANIDDQVAVTTVDQTFRNHTSRPLEATYLFPVPRGASVNKFSLWVDGKETAGELLPAAKARQIYTDIVRRTQDPGLLEYLGNDLMRLRVFPVPPHGDQRVKLSFTAVLQKDAGVVEYLYPAKTDGRATRTLEEFAVTVTIKSRASVQSVYSPTHSVDVSRRGDREAVVRFQKSQALLDKDFQLFYSVSDSAIGLTPLTHRPVGSMDGYAMLILTPQVEAAKATRTPRDLVLVVDTSGSMSDVKMNQAKKAARHLLNGLKDGDRFGLVAFASTVRRYEDRLTEVSDDSMERAKKWVDDLRAGGGTAIQPALDSALDLRTSDTGRSFVVAFFTDGLPTLDERDPAKIVRNIAAKNTANTRIFTFGVGDDVSAALLDQLAEGTRAEATYVRPSEDIEAKAASLAAKISHPVMTDVKLTTTNVRLHEVYPPKLPDLFDGGQLVVIARYTGHGPAAVRLTGRVGGVEKELVYELDFPKRTGDDRDFVEHLWARRKVGYLLDQVRTSGESKEVVDEITALATKYGIATPYTSYLVVPDGPMPVATAGAFRSRFANPSEADRPAQPFGLAPAPGAGGAGGFGPGGPVGKPGEAKGDSAGKKVEDYAKENADKAGGVAAARGGEQKKELEERAKSAPADTPTLAVAEKLQKDSRTLEQAQRNYSAGNLDGNRVGTQGVELALNANALRNQSQLSPTANRRVQGRNLVEVGGVWIDDKFTPKTKTVAVKAQSAAYFRILDRQKQIADVYRLGNHVLWVAPNGTALVIDTNDGKETMTDAEIDALFATKS